jgi:PPK2 family polyphosphate:nucleotide phosphotransferase
MVKRNIVEQFLVKPGKRFRLKDHHPDWAGGDEFKRLKKAELKADAVELLEQNRLELEAAQELLYANDRYSLLIVLQGMDAAGKDGLVKHVMSGLNPMGCQTFSFKRPTHHEYDHTFLWRFMKRLPERGRIGIFNRSYYEDVLVARVHPEVLGPLPDGKFDASFWKRRYEDINAFERHLVRNGTLIVKFMLNVSKGEQKRRLLERLDQPEKNWKFNPSDVAERDLWPKYMECYEDAIRATSSEWAPWHVIPADHKWVARVAVAKIIAETLAGLKLKFPKPSPETAKALAEARRTLGGEAKPAAAKAKRPKRSG